MEENTQEVVKQEKTRKLPSRASILVLGIMSLAFSCCFSILGIIFGFVARGKSNTLLIAGQPVTGPARVGRVFGTIGGVVSIVMTVLVPIAVAAIVIAVVAAAAESPEVANAVNGYVIDEELLENIFKGFTEFLSKYIPIA